MSEYQRKDWTLLWRLLPGLIWNSLGSRRGLKAFLACGVVILGALIGAKAWLDHVKNVQWAIELAGGMDTLISSEYLPAADYDEFFIHSLRIEADNRTIETLKRLPLCTEESDQCRTRALSVINFASISSKDLSGVERFMARYLGMYPASDDKCEAKYEIARTVYASRYALSLLGEEPKKNARFVLATIEEKGGIDYSLRTRACRMFFSAHPTMARAYLAHLAFLMSVEKGGISPGWLFLMAVPGVKSLIEQKSL